MISLKSLVKNMKEAKVTAPKGGVETPLDAKVQIPGFGVMKRKQMQNSIQRYIAEVSKYVKKGKETPLDAKVQIPGYGVMTRKQMQGSI